MALVGDWAKLRTSAECEVLLDKAGVPCSRYFTVGEAQGLPHLAERGSFATIDDGAGPLRVPNPAFKMTNSAAHARDRVPALSADSAGILSNLLHYSAEQIAGLRARKVLAGC